MYPDLLPHLRQVGNLKPGDQQPDWMKTGDASALISQLCRQAVEVIEQLQAAQESKPKRAKP